MANLRGAIGDRLPASRQHRKEPNRKLTEVGDIDVPVTIEIEVGQVVLLAGELPS
jgi:hypothetical protein